MKIRAVWILPFVALAGGLACGMLFGPQSPRSDEASAIQDHGQANGAGQQTVAGPQGIEAAGGTTPRSQARQPKGESAWSLERFVEATKFPSTLHRRWALKRFFDGLASDQFATALRDLESFKGTLDLEALPMLFRSWVAVEPEAALRNARALSDARQRTIVLGAAVRAWGRRDNPGALAWVEKNLVGIERQANMSSLNSIAAAKSESRDSKTSGRSPQDELHELAQEPDRSKAMLKASKIFSQWAATDPAAAAREAMNLNSLSERHSMLYNVLGTWVQRDVASAGNFLESISDERLKNSVRSSLLSFLKTRDPQLAKNFALTLPSGRTRVREIGNVIAAMFERDPDGAIVFYDGLSEEDKRGSFGGFVKAWKEGDPAQAAEALLASSPLAEDATPDQRASRANNFTNALKPWIKRDARAAGEMAVLLPQVERANVLFAVGQEWCSRDAPAAGAWAAALPPGPGRNEAMKQFTYEWAQHDASQVTTWINRLPADSGKAAAAEGFAFSIFDTDPDAALSWTRVIPDEPARLEALSKAWSQWRWKNSAAANDWLTNASGLTPAERAALQQTANAQ